MSISTVKLLAEGYLVNGVKFVPDDPANSDYQEVQDWVTEGNTPDPEFTDAERLANKRAAKKEAIKDEALSRCQARVPALNSFAMIDFLRELWPMLDTASAGADMIAVKDIVVYAKTKIGQLDSATEAQIDAYDPATDPSFPS